MMEDRRARMTDKADPAGEAAFAAGGRARFRRRLSKAGVDPFTTVEWERRDAVIQGEGGKTVFEQRGPWSTHLVLIATGPGRGTGLPITGNTVNNAYTAPRQFTTSLPNTTSHVLKSVRNNR